MREIDALRDFHRKDKKEYRVFIESAIEAIFAKILDKFKWFNYICLVRNHNFVAITLGKRHIPGVNSLLLQQNCNNHIQKEIVKHYVST